MGLTDKILHVDDKFSPHINEKRTLKDKVCAFKQLIFLPKPGR